MLGYDARPRWPRNGLLAVECAFQPSAWRGNRMEELGRGILRAHCPRSRRGTPVELPMRMVEMRMCYARPEN